MPDNDPHCAKTYNIHVHVSHHDMDVVDEADFIINGIDPEKRFLYLGTRQHRATPVWVRMTKEQVLDTAARLAYIYNHWDDSPRALRNGLKE